MKVVIMVAVDIADHLIDPSSPTGVAPEAIELINDALYNLGSDMEVKRMPSCDHPTTEVDGEYLRCSTCKTIVGRS